ncbi:hypothetical protein D3C79_1106930 [compost metagenome]
MAVIQFGKFLLVAIQRDMHAIAGAGLENGLHFIIGLIIAVIWRRPGLDAACLARARGQ